MTESLVDLAESLAAVEATRATAAQVLREQWAPARLRAMLDEETPGWAPDLWVRAVGLGWPDLLVAEADGGGGGTTAQLAGIAEEVGRAAASIPFVPAAVAAWCGGPSGPLRTVAFSEPGGSDDALPSARARAAGGGVVLTGTKAFVPYGSAAQSFVTSAVREDSGAPVLCTVDADADGVTVTALRALDAAPLADVAFDEVRVDAAAVLVDGPEARRILDGARARLAVGWAAELVGVAAAVHDAATEYARHRVAFGRPIGAFQAIKHRLVDLRGDIEVARALVGRAAQAIERDASDADAMVALAAFWAGERLRAVPEGAIQVFGGIGYTWEHDAHLYLRRAAVLRALLPPPEVTTEVALAALVAPR
ncbi:MAG: acyl-CoA dehydrogenase [Actinobacteria bacterium]|nr:acyl-CoA dehydrogenase [Actinomycetota bacterium]